MSWEGLRRDTDVLVRFPDVVQSYWESEANVSQVTAKLEELGWVEAARKRGLPETGPSDGGRQVHEEGGDHAEVVPPGQVQHSCVVFLPVTDEEADVNIPEETEHSEG